MWRVSETPGNYIITTAGGETMGLSGEMLVDIKIGGKKIPHKVFNVYYPACYHQPSDTG